MVCEGQTEEAYFRYISRVLRGSGVVIKSARDSTAPDELVALAIKYKKGDDVRGLEPDAFDEVWAVFDWDNQTSAVRTAMQQAERHGIRVALSNPSFEVWVIWHFQEFMTTGCLPGQVEAQLLKAWPDYTKGTQADFSKLPSGGTTAALERAMRADTAHAQQGRSYPENRSSSGVQLLVRSIIETWSKANPSGATCPLH